MNTVRRVPTAIEGTYISVKDGVLVKADKESAFSMYGQFPDWALFTELTGAGMA